MKLRHLEPSQRFRKSKSKGWRKEAYRRAHGLCWYCGHRVKLRDFRLDHQEPFSLGGADSKRNLVVSCHRCDLMKGALTVEAFRAKLLRRLGADAKIVFHGECGRRRDDDGIFNWRGWFPDEAQQA